MRVLILGGNGFIGSEICRVLFGRGHAVMALVRAPEKAQRRLPNIAYLCCDLRGMQAASDWAFLSDFDAVVNAAGALQDSSRDDVAAVQQGAMLALYAAASTARIRLIVQISARTDGPGSDREFLATKHQADQALKQSGVAFIILRPAVVIGRNAYGGSALLRALAAIPCRTPLIHAEAQMQFAALSDVAQAAGDAIEGHIPTGSDLIVAAPETLSVRHAVAEHRAWLGLPPAKTVEIPAGWAQPVVWLADLLGSLGWRSPLRSTAIEIAGGGAAVTPSLARTAERAAAPLAATLAANPAGVQDLWFARLYLIKPLILGVLSLFWFASGAIALLHFDQTAGLLADAIGSRPAASALTVATSLADLLLGMAVFRRFARPALIGMVLLSLAYLLAATIVAPELWADPLGPLVKVLPATMLALVALAILDER